MGSLYLIRHGQASFGKNDYDQMSELGINQARILGDFFKSRGIGFDAVYSGSLNRHVLTADAVRKAAGAVLFPEALIDPAFNEFDGEGIFRSYLPILAGKEPDFVPDINSIFKDNRSFQKIFSKIVELWISGDHEVEGVESWKAFLRRVEAGFDWIAKLRGNGECVAIVTSGGVIAAALKKAMGLSDSGAIKESWKCMNCSISVFEFNSGTLTLQDFNNTEHLEALNDKGLLTYR